MDLSILALVIACLALVLSLVAVWLAAAQRAAPVSASAKGDGRAAPTATFEFGKLPAHLKELVERLDEECRRGLVLGAQATIAREQAEIEVEHWLLKLLEHPGKRIAELIKRNLLPVTLTQELTAAVRRFPSGNRQDLVLSINLILLVERAHKLAFRDFNDSRVRAGHVLYALLTDKELLGERKQDLPALARINVDALRETLDTTDAAKAE
jgi:type VI secretion system protein VasG